jgi:hypothetical protein
VRLADRLRGEFRRAGDEQRFRARALEADDLRVDGGLGDFVRDGGDLLVEVAPQEGLERVDVVFAKVVILVEDRVFRVRQRPGEELCVDLPFGVEADEARVVSGKSTTLVNLFDPDTMPMVGTPREIRYFATAVLPGVPSWLNMKAISSLSTSLRACSTAFGGA